MSSSTRKRRLVSPQQEEQPQALQPRPDRIVLDVGGTRFTTSATTLTSKRDYFASMLSHWCDDGPPESLFLDRDPEPFKVLLTYMRTGLLELSADNASLARRVLVDAQFLGMQGLIDSVKMAVVENTGNITITTGQPPQIVFDLLYGSLDAAIRCGALPDRYFGPAKPDAPKIEQLLPAPPGTRVRICYEEFEEVDGPDDELIQRWAERVPIELDALCLVHYDTPKHIPVEEVGFQPSRLDAYVTHPEHCCTELASEVFTSSEPNLTRTVWYELVAADDEKIIEIPEGTLNAKYVKNADNYSEGHITVPVRHLRVSTNGFGAPGYVPVALTQQPEWPRGLGLSRSRHKIVRWESISRGRQFVDFP
jgi:hypothetical protein